MAMSKRATVAWSVVLVVLGVSEAISLGRHGILAVLVASLWLLGGFLFVFVGARLLPGDRVRSAIWLTGATWVAGLALFLRFVLSTGTPAAAVGGWWILFGGTVGGLVIHEAALTGKAENPRSASATGVAP
jgi:hypothetical protein